MQWDYANEGWWRISHSAGNKALAKWVSRPEQPAKSQVWSGILFSNYSPQVVPLLFLWLHHGSPELCEPAVSCVLTRNFTLAETCSSNFSITGLVRKFGFVRLLIPVCSKHDNCNIGHHLSAICVFVILFCKLVEKYGLSLFDQVISLVNRPEIPWRSKPATLVWFWLSWLIVGNRSNYPW